MTTENNKPAAIIEAREIITSYAQECSTVDEGNLYFAATQFEAAYDSLAQELQKAKEENVNLSVKIQRTVNAAYQALLETTGWMGIPEKKRFAHIDEVMSNVKFCSEHDVRHVDESQRNIALSNELQKSKEREKALVLTLEKYKQIVWQSRPEGPIWAARDALKAHAENGGEV